MIIPAWALKARTILSRIADFFEAGRKAGLWSQTNSMNLKNYKDIK